MVITHKRCAGPCGQVKELSAFSRLHKSRDGSQPRCKQCAKARRTLPARDNARRKTWLAVMPDWRRDQGLKLCRGCGRTQPAEAHQKHRNTRDGRQPKCATCVRQVNRGWAVENSARKAVTNARWKQHNAEKSRNYVHRRRARIASSLVEEFSSTDIYADWEEHDLWGCFFCAGPLDQLQIDHFVAIDNGGPHALHNLVPSCRECNQSKGAREEWGFLADRLEERGIDLDACLSMFDVDDEP